MPSTSVIQTWSSALHAIPVYIHAPAFANDIKSKELFLEQVLIQEGLKELENMDMIIAAIGSSDRDATILQLDIIPDLDAGSLQENSIGDISYHFFQPIRRVFHALHQRENNWRITRRPYESSHPSRIGLRQEQGTGNPGSFGRQSNQHADYRRRNRT